MRALPSWILLALVPWFGLQEAGRTPDQVLADGTRLAFESRSGRTYYAITMADGRTSGWRPAHTEIHLRSGAFDPHEATLAAQALVESGDVRLIQFETPCLVPYLDELARLGIEVHRFLPEQAVVAHVPEAASAALESLAFVRWVGPFPAEHRLEPELRDDLFEGRLPAESRYSIQVMRRGLADKLSVAARIAELKGSTAPLVSGGFLLTAALSPAALAGVAGLDEVLWIERALEPVALVNGVRIEGGAERLESETGFSGQGVRGEVIDFGLAEDHPDLQLHPPLIHGGNSNIIGHGTEVMGILFGSGATKEKARGLLPEAQGIFTAVAVLEDRYAHTRETVLPPFDAVFQTNSWGTGVTFPGYPNVAFQMDDLVLQFDLLTCQAMGNEGKNRGVSEAWAKNAVSVGGVNHFNTVETADDAWSRTGSIGPGQDGRIKPDLCYWYDSILTIQGNTGHTGMFGGTSAATPQVAGHFGLFFQMWHAELFGNVAGAETVFASRPHSATARAMVANTAEPYPFEGSDHDLTRLHQGWGRPDVARLLDLADGLLVVDEWRPLKNLEQAAYRVSVAQGQERLRATLVYTDASGTTAASLHRINDLSLRLTSPSGTVYRGNVGLDVGNVSSPGGEADRLNTTEQVWLDHPEPGTWLVEIAADEVVQDTHLETPELDADFALVVAPVAAPSSDLGRALAGAAGEPRLRSNGYFVAESPWELELDGAAPNRTCFFVLGDRAVERPFRGGVLVPEPDRFFRVRTDESGKARIDGTFPRGVAHGKRLFVQVWVDDPSGPEKLTASNALELRTP